MTQRLPIPGQDDGTWGNILNGYLGVEHNADGSLKIRSDGSVAPLTSGKVPVTNLGAGTASSSNYLRGDGTWAVPLGTGASNATTSTPGLVQLTGDLAGTATAPTVAKVNGVSLPASAPSNGNVLTALTSTTTTWSTPAAGVTLDATSTDIVAGTITGTGVAGSVGKASDAGHQHPLVAHDHTTTNKGGQIPVGGLSATGTASATTYLRGDGSWTTPAAGVALDSTSADIQPLGTQAAGSLGTAAKADHVHAMPRHDQILIPTAAVAWNAQKITGLANGTTPTDAAAFGQIPVAGTTGSTYTAGNDSRVVGALQASNNLSDLASSSAALSNLGAAAALATTAVKTGAYTATANQLIPADATTAAFTVTLPTAPADKTRVLVKKIDSSANAVTIAAGGSDVFNKASGATALTLTLQNQAINLQYASSTSIWYVVGDDLPLSGLDGRYLTSKVFNPRSYGAVMNGSTDDSAALASTFTAMKLDGTHATGRLVIDGPLFIASPIILDGGYTGTSQSFSNGGNQGFYLDSNQGEIIAAASLGASVTVRGFYGAHVDLRFQGGGTSRTISDASMTASSGDITSSTANFISADIGKYVRVEGGGTLSAVPYIARITSIGSTTVAHTDGTATTTVSGAAATIQDIALHIENVVNLSLNLWASNFAGLVLHCDPLGVSNNYSTQCTVRSLYTLSCGQAISFKAVQGGFGAFLDVWDDDNTQGSVIDTTADTTFLHYENFSPATQTCGVLFNSCSDIYISEISLGDRPNEALLKIVGPGFDFGHIDKVRVGGRTNVTAGTGTIDGLKLVEVSSIDINEVVTLRCAKGVHVSGGGSNSISIKRHFSQTADTTALYVEPGPSTAAPILDVGLHYRFCVNPVILGTLTGGTVKLHGHLDNTIFQGGASGFYAVASTSTAVLDVAGLTQDARTGLAGLTNHTGTLRGTIDAHNANGSPSKGSIWYADGTGNLVQLAAGGNGQVPTWQTDGSIAAATPGGGGTYVSVLTKNTSQVIVTNTTTETALVTYTIPANSVANATVYRITAGGAFDNGTLGGTLTFRVRIGGVSGTSLFPLAFTVGTTAGSGHGWSVVSEIIFRGAASSTTPVAASATALANVSSPVVLAGPAAVNVNMTTARDIVLDAIWSVADTADILRCEYASIEQL